MVPAPLRSLSRLVISITPGQVKADFGPFLSYALKLTRFFSADLPNLSGSKAMYSFCLWRCATWPNYFVVNQDK